MKLAVGRARLFITAGVQPEVPRILPRLRVMQWVDGTPVLRVVWYGFYVAFGWGRAAVFGSYMIYPAP